MCFIVVSVCTIVNLRHRVSLAPLFGSMYITVLNCICYVVFNCLYDDLCYIICTVLRGRYCVIQHSCCDTNKTTINSTIINREEMLRASVVIFTISPSLCARPTY